MHIRHLVVTDNFAGVERYVATTATELARRGHTIDVIGGDQAAMRHVLADADVNVNVTGASGMRGALRALTAAPRPDVVHTHMTSADIAAVVTRPIIRRPVVSTLHFAQPRGHDGITQRVYSIIPKLLTREIAISSFVAARVGERPVVIPNGVPDPRHTTHGPGPAPATAGTGTQTLPDASSPAGGDHTPVVLVAQRFETEKRTADAITAFAESGLSSHGWELHLAGRGSQRAELERLASTLGITESVRFLDHVDDLDTRMDTATVFLATADAEPFGLSVVEAMAHGLPVVAADGGAHRETLQPATPEAVYTAGDVVVCAALLRRLADDPDLRADLGRRVRIHYEAEFTIETHVDRLEALYRDVVAHAPGH